MGTDLKGNPTDDWYDPCADLPRGQLGAYLLSTPIGTGTIKRLAAPLNFTAHATTTSTSNLVVEMFFVVMLRMALTLRITRILIDVMSDVFAMFMTNGMLLAAPLRVKFVKLVATVSRIADDPLLWPKRLGSRTLVDRNFNFFKRSNQTRHLFRLLAATMRAAIRSDSPAATKREDSEGDQQQGKAKY